MQYNINIKALASEFFGYKVLPYRMPQESVKDQTGNDSLVATAYEAEATGLLGLPVFTSLQLTAPGVGNITLLDVILTVELEKNIVITPVTGRKGTVKEFISSGDYAVTVQGVLATAPDAANRFAYPAGQVETFRKILEAEVALQAVSARLAVHGIKNLVVKNFKWPAAPGTVNIQPFELQCLSDEPFELQLKN